MFSNTRANRAPDCSEVNDLVNARLFWTVGGSSRLWTPCRRTCNALSSAPQLHQRLASSPISQRHIRLWICSFSATRASAHPANCRPKDTFRRSNHHAAPEGSLESRGGTKCSLYPMKFVRFDRLKQSPALRNITNGLFFGCKLKTPRRKNLRLTIFRRSTIANFKWTRS